MIRVLAINTGERIASESLAIESARASVRRSAPERSR